MLNLGIRCLSPNNESIVKAMLALTRKEGRMAWQYSDDLAAMNAIIIDLDNELGMRLYSQLNEQHHYILIACASNISLFSELKLALQKPIRSADLIAVLHQAAAQANGSTRSFGAPIPYRESPYPPKANTTDTIVVSESLERVPASSLAVPTDRHPRLVDILLTTKPDEILCITGFKRLILMDKYQQCYYANSAMDDDVKALLTGDCQQILVRKLTTQRAAEYLRALTAWELAPLVWKSLIEDSKGHLLNGLPYTSTYQLKRWPDFNKVGHHPLHIKLAVILTRQTSTIDNLAWLLKAPTSTIVDFINACYALDYLLTDRAVSSVKTAKPKELSENRRGLFARIRSRLGL